MRVIVAHAHHLCAYFMHEHTYQAGLEDEREPGQASLIVVQNWFTAWRGRPSPGFRLRAFGAPSHSLGDPERKPHVRADPPGTP